MSDPNIPHEDPARIEARLRRMVQRWPDISGYRLNPDAEIVEGIIRALARSTTLYGYPYCPCRDVTGDRQQDRDNMCPCVHHHDEILRDSHCKCVLFVGEAYDPAVAYRPQTGGEIVSAVRSIRHRTVTVYSTRWCFHSRRAKALLEKESIVFEDIDIEGDPEAALRVEEWNGGYRSVPTICTRMVITEPTIAELERILLTPGLVVEGLDVYVTNWCSQSRRTVRWMEEQRLDARVIDVERDAEAANRVQQWNDGNLSVPTLEVRLRLTEPAGEYLAQSLGLGVA
jgi:ferredoxin-thioredoxin reductase catalytic subunit/glutaredoxin